MRILFSSVGNYGHIYPLLPLAIAARADGHEVVFGTGERFHPILLAAGLEPVAAGTSVPEAFMEAAGSEAFRSEAGHATAASELTPEVLQALSLKAFGSVLPRHVVADLAPHIERFRPDLIVHEVQNPGAGFAAELAGIPALCHGNGRFPADVEEAALIAELRATAADLGVTVPAEQAFTLGNPYLDICPPSLQDPALLASSHPRLELRPVPFAEPGELPDGVVGGDRPLVYVTLGTALGAAEVLRTAIEGLAALDVRVLVSTGPTVEIAALGELPSDVTALPWVPQADILPHTALIVHHGGAGTTLASLGAGLPQLVLPQGADNFSNAAAIRTAGAGEQLFGADLTAEAVTTTVRKLLADESYRDAAKSVAAEIAAMPAPAEVAKLLPNYVH